MESYELWNAVMYGVGVFVTCNVGGQLLLRLFAARKRPTAPDCKPVRADERVTAEPYAVAYGGELVKVGGGQSFEEMRRQTESGRRTDADAAPEESGRRTDGGLAPRESANASGESVTETGGDSQRVTESGAESVGGKRQPGRFAPLSPSVEAARQSWLMHWEQTVGDSFPESSKGALTEDFRAYSDEYGGEAVVTLITNAIHDGLTLIPWQKLETDSLPYGEGRYKLKEA